MGYGLNELVLKRVTGGSGGSPGDAHGPGRQCTPLAQDLFWKQLLFLSVSDGALTCPKNIFTSIMKEIELVFLSTDPVLGGAVFLTPSRM